MRLSQPIPQPRSAFPNPNPDQLSKSTISSKSLTPEIALQGQIVQLKAKAHQSFMQVIQMQQLHEEELQQLRLEFTEKENAFLLQLQMKNKEVEDLEVRIKQLEFENLTLQKNARHHLCDVNEDEFEIENVDLISCGEQSNLNQSSIVNFQEIVNTNSKKQQLKFIKDEIMKQLKAFPNYEDSSILQMIEKMFEYISHARTELVRIQEKQVQKEREKVETKESQNSKIYDSLQKESKFMAEHIKRLSGEKMKVEKKLAQTERQVKKMEENHKKLEIALQNRGIKLDQIAKNLKSSHCFLEEHEQSLQLNEFISQNFKNSSSLHPAHKHHHNSMGRKSQS